MGSRRCSQCGTDWPDNWGDYAKCPDCDVKTDRMTNATPMDADEALSLKKHYAFERFYEEREAKLLMAAIEQQTADGSA